jgi:hypothetical protein
MRGKLLAAVLLVVLWGGCGERPSPAPLTTAPPAESSPAAAQQAGPAEPDIAPKAATEPMPAGSLAKYGATYSPESESKLPLKLTFDVPEVPPEILGPSPPISAEKKP